MRTIYHYFFVFVISLLLLNCRTDDSSSGDSHSDDYTPTPTSPVVLDLSAVPYPKLSDYHLFEGPLAEMIPSYGVHPYDLRSQLFTDYASKKRFVWMPTGVKAKIESGDEIINFPIGTILVKTFYYPAMLPNSHREIIETRIMIKRGIHADGSDDWLFANYIWNEDQTEALLDMNGSNREISFTNEYNDTYTTTYRIPSETECLICHKNNEKAIPVGPKPYNMDFVMTYEEGNRNQLDYWVNHQLLEGNFSRNYTHLVDWKNEGYPIKDRLRSYLEINCAHCHSEGKHCDYRPIRLGYYESESESNLGVCIAPDDNINSTLTAIIAPNNIARSVMHFRMNSTEEAYRMPLLGRSIVDKQAVELLEAYIQSLQEPCF